MSELNVTTLTNQDVQLCKAWVNFDGTLAAASMIQASYNVSSITDNGVGDYTINLATPMVDTEYTVSSSPLPDWGTVANGVYYIGLKALGTEPSLKTVSAFTIFTLNNVPSLIDCKHVMLQVFGN